MSPAALRERAASSASSPAAHESPDMQTLLRRPLPAPATWTGNALTITTCVHRRPLIVLPLRPL